MPAWQKDFNVYIFPAHTPVTLTSLTEFEGKKMQSGTQETCFSSKYCTLKEVFFEKHNEITE